MKLSKLASAIAATMLLSACGSGGVDNTPEQREPAVPQPDLIINQELETLRGVLESTSPDGSLSGYAIPMSDDFDNIPHDPLNPITAEKVALGKLLYHETGILRGFTNNDQTGSCATCHNAQHGFKSGIRQGLGDGGAGFGVARVVADGVDPILVDHQPVTSPTSLNAAYQDVMLWNGKLGNSITGIVNAGLDPEIITPDNSPLQANLLGYSGIEVQGIVGQGAHRLNVGPDSIVQNNPVYLEMYEAAFPGGFDDWIEVTALAIASYERTVLANQSPFQKFLRGDQDAMTDQMVRGANVFFGDGGCVECHQGPALSSRLGASEDEMFMAVGFGDLDYNNELMIGVIDEVTRKGRGGFTGDPNDDYKFKITPLYNLKDTNVFGHGGSFTSVREVVEYKNAGVPQADIPAENLDYRFYPLGLSDDQIDDLVVFLEDALYDPDLVRYVPDELPSGLCPTNNDELSREQLGCEP